MLTTPCGLPGLSMRLQWTVRTRTSRSTEALSAEVAALDAGHAERGQQHRNRAEHDQPPDVDAVGERIVARVVVEDREVLEPGDRADERRETVDQPAGDDHTRGDPRGKGAAAGPGPQGDRERAR